MLASLITAIFNDSRWVIRGFSLFSHTWVEDGEYRWRWTADTMAWFYNLASGFEDYYRVEAKR